MKARTLTLVCAALVIVAGNPAAAAYQPPGLTERVSVASDGTEGNQRSTSPHITADGRYVAFTSRADNFAPSAFDECPAVVACDQVFVHDRETGVTELVSVASDGSAGNRASHARSISPDGRYVAFESFASNLAPGITNGSWDAYVHDRETQTTERVSVASDGTEGNGHATFPSLSADGRYVAFESWADNLVPGDDNGTRDIFVHDRETAVTERVSVDSDGGEAVGASSFASISADGRHVAFISTAWDPVSTRPFGIYSVAGLRNAFVHDRETGVTERVSEPFDGTRANGQSNFASISADGRHVAFSSGATNLVAGDTNGVDDVFVRDLQTGRTERVSVASDGTEADGPTGGPSISADGRYVAFHGSPSNLAAGPDSGFEDVFVHDRQTGTTERVSVASDGSAGNNASRFASISGDGRFVGFASWASNLVPGDGNQTSDVFVRDRGPAVGVGNLAADHAGGQVTASGWASLSGQVVTSVADPPDDGVPGAEQAGGELTGASLVYRPEQEDLLVRLRLTSLPAEPGFPTNSIEGGGCVPFTPVPGGCVPRLGAGAPGVLYGVAFALDGTRYEVRAVRTVDAAAPPVAPRFALYRCDPGCVEHAPLSGGLGATGPEVLASVPLAVLDADAGAALTEVRAFTAFGEMVPGALATLDEAALPSSVIPTAYVSLGIAPAAAGEDEVAFDTEADLVDGRFSAVVDVAGLPAGAYRVWARACLGDVCGTRTVDRPL